MVKEYSKIEWCCIQKNGIKLIEPNEVLGESYLDAADADLLKMQSPALKIQNLSAYDACYNSFYAILQKAGIKCEMHDCSFEVFSLISGFGEEQVSLISVLRKNNIEIEEGLMKPKRVDGELVEEFVATAKQVFNSLTFDKIRLIRKEIERMKKKRVRI